MPLQPIGNARSFAIDIVITGANSAIGKSLVERFGRADQIVPTRLRGLVRRLDRADNLRSTMAEIIEVDYSDSASLCTAMEDADCIIHLAGALIPRPGETLLEANARLTESVVEAAQNVEVGNIVYLSYPGANPSAKNLYLRSKGLAEKAIQSSGLCGVIFRAPMVLGRGTATTQAILRLATKSFPLLAGGGTTRHQPIFQADVLSAIEWAVSTPPDSLLKFDLLGPETISLAELIRRVADRSDRKPKIIPLPKSAVWLAAWLAGSLFSARTFNRTTFEILFTEHLGNPFPARTSLPFSLTPLEEMVDRAFLNIG